VQRRCQLDEVDVPAVQAQALADVCGPEGVNSSDVFKKKQEWYGSNWQKWKMAYYAAAINADAKTKTEPIKETGKRESIRNQYVDARLDLANEYFRRFVAHSCKCQAWPLTEGQNTGDGPGAEAALNRVMAARATIIARIKTGLRQSADSYPLIEAEQDLADLELSSLLPATADAAMDAICQASPKHTAQPAAPTKSAESARKAAAAPDR